MHETNTIGVSSLKTWRRASRRWMRWSRFESSKSRRDRRTRDRLEMERMRVLNTKQQIAHHPTVSFQQCRTTSTVIHFSILMTRVSDIDEDPFFVAKTEFIFVAVPNDKFEKQQRRASVCSLDSGTSLSFLSSTGTRNSDNKLRKDRSSSNYSSSGQIPSTPVPSRSTEV